MKPYILTKRARLDVDEICGFIAEDDVDAADRVAEEIYKPALAISQSWPYGRDKVRRLKIIRETGPLAVTDLFAISVTFEELEIAASWRRRAGCASPLRRPDRSVPSRTRARSPHR